MMEKGSDRCIGMGGRTSVMSQTRYSSSNNDTMTFSVCFPKTEQDWLTLSWFRIERNREPGQREENERGQHGFVGE